MIFRRSWFAVASVVGLPLATRATSSRFERDENDRLLQGTATTSAPAGVMNVSSAPVSVSPVASTPSPSRGGNTTRTAAPSPASGAGTTPSPTTASANQPSVTPVTSLPTLADLIAANADYGGFSTAVTMVSPDLTERLSSLGNATTVFAADNDAFRNMDPVLTAKLQTEQYAFHFTDLVNYHAFDGIALTSNFSTGTTLTMLNNNKVQVSVDNATGELVLNNPYNASLVNRMILKDVPASNGVMTGITGEYGPLMPDFVFLDVAGKIASVQALSNFTEWIVSSGLDLSLLRQEGITVLVPGNQAFSKAESPFLDYYGDPDNAAELRSLLMYHIVPIMLPTTMFRTESLPTLLTNRIGAEVNEQNGTVTFNDGTAIVIPNLLAWNGIVHEIDSFLTPPETAFPTPQPKVGDPTTPTASMPAPSPPVVPTAAAPTKPPSSPTVPSTGSGTGDGAGGEGKGTSSGQRVATCALSTGMAAILLLFVASL